MPSKKLREDILDHWPHATSTDFPNGVAVHRTTVYIDLDHLMDIIREERIKARKAEVQRFARKYRPINKPIKDSPMELTDKAKWFNEIAEDIVKYEDQRLAELSKRYKE